MPAIEPIPHTATQRRELRRKVRNHLGAHSTEAPAVLPTVRAALDLLDLLRLTTNGGIRLALIDGETGAELSHGQALDLARTGTYTPLTGYARREN
jgi:hypothetical protein